MFVDLKKTAFAVRPGYPKSESVLSRLTGKERVSLILGGQNTASHRRANSVEAGTPALAARFCGATEASATRRSCQGVDFSG